MKLKLSEPQPGSCRFKVEFSGLVFEISKKTNGDYERISIRRRVAPRTITHADGVARA